MSLKQACEILGISRMTLLRRVNDGKITPLPKPATLMRRHRLEFSKAEIERFANQSAS